MNVKLTGPADPEIERAIVLLSTGAPVHVVLEKMLNVTVPVEPNPPDTRAVSDTEPPTTMELVESDVETDGVDFATVTVSVPQVLFAIVLFPSP